MTNEQTTPIRLSQNKKQETNDNSKQQQQQVSSSIQQQVTIGTTSTASNDGQARPKNEAAGAQQLAPAITQRQQAVRPARPNHFRRAGHPAVLAAEANSNLAAVRPPTQLIRHPIELAGLSGPHPVGVGPPRRPAHLPARYDTLTRVLPPPPPPQAAASATGKPNRYSSWAHVQSNWRAAAAGIPGTRPRTAAAAAAAMPVDGAYPHPHHHHHFSSPFSSAASRMLVVNPMQIVNLSEHTKSRLVKIIEALKRFSEKWFSHVLLLMFLALYACFGAYIFINFEAPTEQWEKQMIIDTRQRLVNESWMEARGRNQSEFLDVFRSKLEDYERLLNRACASGMTSSSLENQWTFWGALFYSMTVFTTIGYGHLTPITFAGRVATMIYAIFGIPILLMVLADLGKLLTRIIKYAFKQFRSLYNQLLHRKTSIRTRKIISDNTNHCIGAARGAFERGYAHIQPYYRLPNALARAGSFRHRFRRSESGKPRTGSEPENDAAAAAAAVAATVAATVADTKEGATATNTTTTDTLDHHEQHHHHLGEMAPPENSDHHHHSIGQRVTETTDVIVTPTRQTKPVSPPVKDRRQSPLDNHISSQPSSHHRPHDHSNQHHNNHHHHIHHSNSGRAQSPASSSSCFAAGKRKGSLGGGATATATGGSNKRKTPATYANKGQVSRSSSLSSSVVLQNNSADSRLKPTSTSRPSDNHALPSPVAAHAMPLDSTNVDCDTTGAKRPETLGDLDLTETMASGHPADYDEEEVELDIGAMAPEDEDDLGEPLEGIEDEFDIPVSFALFLLVTYMMFGAVVFSIWEGWNFFDSLYFVFISMSTIGFGDLVPQHPKRMIGTFIYLLFGLALTSMCINVVQEKIHATFLRAKMQIGEKMGLDLDQIMADDYYDGSTLECDPEDDLHSVAASQTNSSLACHMSGGGLDGGDPMDPDGMNMKPHVPVEAGMGSGGGGSHFGGDGVKQSRSKDSIRSKRRTVTGLPGHNTGGSGGSMLRRSHSKKLQRQVTPSSLQGSDSQSHRSHSHPQTPVACCSATVASNSSSPSRPDGELASKMTQSGPPPAPAINQPASEVARGTCEPLQRKPSQQANVMVDNDLGEGGRTKLMVANSHTPTASGSPSGDFRIPKSLSSEAGFEPIGGHSYGQPRRPSGSALGTVGQQRQQLGPEPPKGRHRSAESSRRSSVSHELNELDDLLLKLSHCQLADERFGPLLGIPSKGRRHSRPNSATPNDNRNDNTISPNNRVMSSGAKRGASMINRSASQFQASAPSSSASFYARARSPLVGRDHPTGGGGGSTAFVRLPVSSGRNWNSTDSQPVNQDDLETIKFSAV